MVACKDSKQVARFRSLRLAPAFRMAALAAQTPLILAGESSWKMFPGSLRTSTFFANPRSPAEMVDAHIRSLRQGI